MQTVDTEIDCSTLTSLNNLFLHLFLNLRNNFFDACRVNTPICNELMKGQTADFTTNGVESRDYNGFGRIIYYNFYTCSSFECTNVAAFTSDNATLHLIVVNMEDCHTVFDSRFSCHTLDRLDNDAFCLLSSSHLRIIHDFVDVTLSFTLCLVLHGIDQVFLSLFSRQSTQFFELLTLFDLHLSELFFLLHERLLLVIEAIVLVFEFLLALAKFVLTLIESNLALLQLILDLQDALIALLHLFFEFSLFV